MKKVILALVMFSLTFNLSGLTNINAKPADVECFEQGTIDKEGWDGVSVQMPTEQETIDGITYYKIGSAKELAYIAKTGGEWLGYNYILTSDIVLNDTELICDVVGNLKIDASTLNAWTPIDGLTGRFNGNGHSISGLYVKTEGSAGLFSNVTGIVSNLTLANIYVEGTQNAGGIAGCASYIENCTVYGSVVGTGNVGGLVGSCSNYVYDSVNYANVFSYGENVGGVAGMGTILEGCANYGYIFGDTSNTGGVVGYLSSCIDSSANYGEVLGRGDNTGGVVGYFYTGTISNCTNYADIRSGGNFAGGIAGRIDHTGSIQHCGNKGKVSGVNYVGGIVGYTPDITLPDGVPDFMIFYHISVVNVCYNTGDISGNNYVGGLMGYGDDCNVAKSYSVGNISGYFMVGALIGESCQMVGANRGEVSGCYYLKNDTINASLTAFGNGVADQAAIAASMTTEFFPICVNPNSDPGYDFLGYAYIVDFVDRLYTNILNRQADTAGKLNWAVTLRNGTHNGASLVGVFVLGEEFKLRNLSDEEYIEVLYRTFFDREADEEGLSNWLAHLQSGYSREYVLSKFVNLEEFTALCRLYGIERGLMFEDGSVAGIGVQQFVERLYEKVLGRKVDSEGFYNWVNAIASKTMTADQVAMNFFNSEEYLIKNTDNATYVKDLYSVFMGREADDEGLTYWVSCIEEYGVTRDWVAAQFAASYEFYLIMQNFGVEAYN